MRRVASLIPHWAQVTLCFMFSPCPCVFSADPLVYLEMLNKPETVALNCFQVWIGHVCVCVWVCERHPVMTWHSVLLIKLPAFQIVWSREFETCCGTVRLWSVCACACVCCCQPVHVWCVYHLSGPGVHSSHRKGFMKSDCTWVSVVYPVLVLSFIRWEICSSVLVWKHVSAAMWIEA